mmetsp:Transcript_7628/g.21389  ORF Transcript_7628/g.21389 Transcript_7628/m.21389 type:complete len:354 (+) Transcript_7628:142-1203(+)
MAPDARLLLPTEIAVGAITITARRRPERARLLRGAFPRRRAPVPHQARRALEDGVLLVQGRAALLPVVVATRIRVHHIPRVRRSLSSSLRPRPLPFRTPRALLGLGRAGRGPPERRLLRDGGLIRRRFWSRRRLAREELRVAGPRTSLSRRLLVLDLAVVGPPILPTRIRGLRSRTANHGCRRLGRGRLARPSTGAMRPATLLLRLSLVLRDGAGRARSFGLIFLDRHGLRRLGSRYGNMMLLLGLLVLLVSCAAVEGQGVRRARSCHRSSGARPHGLRGRRPVVVLLRGQGPRRRSGRVPVPLLRVLEAVPPVQIPEQISDVRHIRLRVELELPAVLDELLELDGAAPTQLR